MGKTGLRLLVQSPGSSWRNIEVSVKQETHTLPAAHKPAVPLHGGYCCRSLNRVMNETLMGTGFFKPLLLSHAGLFISPTMNVLPSTSLFEGDVAEVVCTVVNPPGPVEVYLTKDGKVLKKGARVLNHRLTVRPADAGEYVCKAEYGATQKEAYKSIRVQGRPDVPPYIVLTLTQVLPVFQWT